MPCNMVEMSMWTKLPKRVADSKFQSKHLSKQTFHLKSMDLINQTEAIVQFDEYIGANVVG